MAYRSSSEPLPVTILTGYLGAGKTTLLNHILTGDHGRRIAVIQNEFGEIAIDHDLVIGIEEDIYTMANGCICCTVRDDMIEVMEDLVGREERFDQIIIETTGLAEPGGVVMTLLTHPDAGETFAVDGVVAVVDAVNLPLHLAHGPEAAAQIAYADLLLLNKSDLVDAVTLDRARALVAAINPSARAVPVSFSRADIYDVIDIGGFDPSRIALPPAGEVGHLHHEHAGSISSVGLRASLPLDFDRFERWVAGLIDERHADLYRMKGILDVAGRDRRLIFHAVHALSSWQYGRAWEEGAHRESRFVIIGRNLDRAELEEAFIACAIP
jgi:G3E family GTPase